MIRSAGPLAIAAVALLAACDFHGDDIVIEPEYDLTYSFETGLDMWLPDGTDLADPPVEWDVSVTSEAASEGSSAVRFRLDNMNDQGKIWIERRFALAPDTVYDVDIDFDLGTSDVGEVNLWRVLAGATAADPETAADLIPQDETGGGEGSGVTFVERRYTTRVTANEDGQVWVHVGVWGTYETARTYYVDNLRVAFTRVTPAP